MTLKQDSEETMLSMAFTYGYAARSAGFPCDGPSYVLPEMRDAWLVGWVQRDKELGDEE